MVTDIVDAFLRQRMIHQIRIFVHPDQQLLALQLFKKLQQAAR